MENVKDILGPRREINKPFLGPRNPRSQLITDDIANELVDKFNSPEYRPFFLKVAWRLPRDTIERLVTTAFEKGTNKRAYFITLVKREKLYYEESKIHKLGS